MKWRAKKVGKNGFICFHLHASSRHQLTGRYSYCGKRGDKGASGKQEQRTKTLATKAKAGKCKRKGTVKCNDGLGISGQAEQHTQNKSQSAKP